VAASRVEATTLVEAARASPDSALAMSNAEATTYVEIPARIMKRSPCANEQATSPIATLASTAQRRGKRAGKTDFQFGADVLNRCHVVNGKIPYFG